MNYLPNQSFIRQLLWKSRKGIGIYKGPPLFVQNNDKPVTEWPFDNRHVKLFTTQVVSQDHFEWTVHSRQHWMKNSNQIATTIQTTRNLPQKPITMLETITFLSTADPYRYQASYICYEVNPAALSTENGKNILTYDNDQIVLEVKLTRPQTLEWHRTQLLAKLW